MVRFSFIFALCFLSSFFLFASDTSVSVTIATDALMEYSPIEGQITFIHDGEENWSDVLFSLEDEALHTEHIGDSVQSSIRFVDAKREEKKMILSKYRFWMEGKARGFYTLPSVSVHFGGKTYLSHPLAYQVQEGIEGEDFILQAFVKGRTGLYPGEKTELVYRIYYKRDIDLTVQNLPLLEARGFHKIGERGAISYRSGSYSVQEISQGVEALKPGRYSFGPSFVEGLFYQEDFSGRKNYEERRSRAGAKEVSIEVYEFPSENRPGSFHGMIGDFSMDVSMITPTEVSVGDLLKLKVVFVGKGVFSSIPFSSFFRHQSFKENFRFSDLSPVGKLEGDSIVFIQELRPLSSSVKEVPSIECSFFDPSSHKYRTLLSDPIPLLVKSSSSAPLQEGYASKDFSDSEENEGEDESSSWRDFYEEASRIEILGNYFLRREDLKQNHFPFIVALFLLGLFIFFFQGGCYWFFRKKEKKAKKKRSDDFLKEARNHKKQGRKFYFFLEKAMLLRLYEKGCLGRKIQSFTELSDKGVNAKVRSFFLTIETKRFSRGGKLSRKKVMEKAQKLFGKIESE